jgi:hypothetical protein
MFQEGVRNLTIFLVPAQIVLIYLAFLVFGVLVNSLFGFVGRQKSVHPAVLGMCAIQVVSFYWLYFTSSGISGEAIFLLIAVVLASLVVHRRRFIDVINEFIGQIRNDTKTIGLFLIVFLVQWFTVIQKFGGSISSWNNDVISYGIAAKHISENGFNSMGAIAGTHLGQTVRGDVIGPYSVLAFLSDLYKVNIEKLFLPALGGAFLLLVLATKHVLQRLINGRLATAILSVFPITIPVVAYLGSCYFFSQILSMAIGVSLITLVLINKDKASSDQSKLEFTIGTVLVAGLFLTYPQFVPVVLVFIIFGVIQFHVPTRSIKKVIAILVQFGLGAVLIAPQLHIAVERTISLAGNSTAGWPMPWVSPVGLLGLQESVFSKPSLFQLLLSILLIIFILCAYSVKMEKVVREAVKLGLLILVIYGFVLFEKGNSSYVQFKWISWFAPLFFAVFVVRITRNRWFSMQRMTRHLFLSLLTLTMAFNAYRQTDFNVAENAVLRVPSEDMKNLTISSLLNNFDELNIKTGAFHESMWPIFFIKDTKVALLDSTYFSSSQPVAAPTLVKSSYATLAGVSRIPVNDSYDVVSFPSGLNSKGSTSVKSQIIGPAQLTFARGTEFELVLSVSNTGAATWLGSGSYVGAVNLGVRIRAINGIPLDDEIQRVSLGDFPNYMTSGITRSVSVNLIFEETGDYLIQIEPVSEGLFWFSEFDLQNSLQIEVNVTD